MKAFYAVVGMRNPSRSYFLRDAGQLHSLKAVVTFALREQRPNTVARDFHAVDAAHKLRELGFDVVHNVENADEDREREWISRLKRDGQVEFRSKLIDLYGRCALSGCTTLGALEAAHVLPVSGRGSDAASNGILLRADLHKLFDANLIAINPANGRLRIAWDSRADYWPMLASKTFVSPQGGPSLEGFRTRWDEFQRLDARERPFREQVAHHEAAHAVLALFFGIGLSGGIDLDAETSVAGAFGHSAVKLLQPDASQEEREQRNDLLRNLAIICAGAASDAKLKGWALADALEAQPGDLATAKRHAPLHPVCKPEDLDAAIQAGLETAGTHMNRPNIWRAIEAVASACVANGGKLEASAVEQIASDDL